MSHVTNIKLATPDLDAIAMAVQAMGGEFVRNKTDFKWYGRFLNDWHTDRAAVHQGIDPKTFGKCSHVIRPKGWRLGDYEVGVVWRDGAWDLVYDVWSFEGAKLEEAFGVGLVRLKAEVGAEVAVRKLQHLVDDGWTVERTTDELGMPRLVVTEGGF